MELPIMKGNGTRPPLSGRDINKIVAKAVAFKASKKAQQRQTSTVKTYDMSSDGISKKAVVRKPKTFAERVHAKVKQEKRNRIEQNARHEAAKRAVREPRPLPDPLSVMMAPLLPERRKGDKPNIVALVYAFRAFQQFSYAHARRNVQRDEAYYQGLKKRFRDSLKELGMADMFDWEDF